MTLLKREGMRPITEGFAAAYRAYRDGSGDKRGYKPLDPSVPVRRFRWALGVIGIHDAKGLAEALGKSEATGRNVWKHPHERYTAEHASSLLRRADECERAVKEAIKCGGELDANTAHWIEDACNQLRMEPLYQLPRTAEGRLLAGTNELFSTVRVHLGFDRIRRRLWQAAEEEFAARFLVESYRELSPEGRSTLLSTAYALAASDLTSESGVGLRQNDRSRALAADTLAARAKLLTGDHPDPSDLCILISPEEFKRLDQMCDVLDEYTGYAEDTRQSV